MGVRKRPVELRLAGARAAGAAARPDSRSGTAPRTDDGAPGTPTAACPGLMTQRTRTAGIQPADESAAQR